MRKTDAGPHPLENVPDYDFASPDLKRKVPPTDKKAGLLPLPDHLRVGLHDGRPVRVGAIEVTPTGVELKPPQEVTIRVGDQRPDKAPHATLVLHLKIRNVSTDLEFKPMDVFYNRQWHEKDHSEPPLTYLELGPDQRLYGGPAQFVPRGAQHQVVLGDNHDKLLQPGEEMETFVCTDGFNALAAESVESYHGPLLWRVHLRRGLVRVNGHEKRAGAVIGVEFTDAAYRTKG
jgi:hypothetical protein